MSELFLVLRQMAWQRAKGELNSMLETYFPEWDGNKRVDTGFDAVSELIKKFIKDMESEQ